LRDPPRGPGLPGSGGDPQMCQPLSSRNLPDPSPCSAARATVHRMLDIDAECGDSSSSWPHVVTDQYRSCQFPEGEVRDLPAPEVNHFGSPTAYRLVPWSAKVGSSVRPKGVEVSEHPFMSGRLRPQCPARGLHEGSEGSWARCRRVPRAGHSTRSLPGPPSYSCEQVRISFSRTSFTGFSMLSAWPGRCLLTTVTRIVAPSRASIWTVSRARGRLDGSGSSAPPSDL